MNTFEQFLKVKLGEVLFALWQSEFTINQLAANQKPPKKVKAQCPGQPTIPPVA